MYLGLDLGDKKTGIALYVEGIVVPKAIILRKEIVTTLRKYIQEYNIQKVIVGLPYDLYGTDTKQLQKTKDYIKFLQKEFPNVEFVGHDERFTSFEADNILTMLGKTGEKKDDISAALILESYLKL